MNLQKVWRKQFQELQNFAWLWKLWKCTGSYPISSFDLLCVFWFNGTSGTIRINESKTRCSVKRKLKKRMEEGIIFKIKNEREQLYVSGGTYHARWEYKGRNECETG